jgi:hypothetical protein
MYFSLLLQAKYSAALTVFAAETYVRKIFFKKVLQKI